MFGNNAISTTDSYVMLSNLLCFVLFLEHMNKILYLEQMTKISPSKCVSFIASFGVGIFSKLGHCVVFSDGQKLDYKGC